MKSPELNAMLGIPVTLRSGKKETRSEILLCKRIITSLVSFRSVLVVVNTGRSLTGEFDFVRNLFFSRILTGFSPTSSFLLSKVSPVCGLPGAEDVRPERRKPSWNP